LFDAAPDAVLGVDADGAIVFANVQAQALFGWDPADLVGQPIEVLVPEGSRARHPAHRKGYVVEPRPRPMGAGVELRGRRRDGSSFPAEISLGPVEDDHGGVLVIAAVRDVTEQRRAQARFRTLLEGAPDAVVGLDGDGTVVLINAQAEERFATSRTRAVGEGLPALLAGTIETADGVFTDLVPTEDRTRLEDAVTEVLDGRRDGLTLRFRVTRPDGDHAVLEALGRALDDVSGEGGMLLISRDVSEHVGLEVALRAAKDEADEANQAKNRFLSRVSHELRTPLNAILGFGQLLEMKELATDDAEAVRQVLSGGRHLLNLVNEVLDIARIESEELVSSTGPVALAPLVRELLELVAPLADERRVSLDRGSADACDAWVEADHDRLRQVLLNLVANGIKYNHPGGHVGLRHRRGRSHLGDRRRVGDLRGRPGAPLPALRPAGRRAHGRGGHGDRAGPVPRPGARHGRPDRGGVGGGPGQHLLDRAAAGGRHPDARWGCPGGGVRPAG
jgi:protein-histidine pros-kinase